ncbi:MAG: NAD-dependent epimerase/dehydratase family protein [Bdellovibrionales bacterium]|nr:NAD-dependent epimerase/dehydratase family protein [Bdellovibrionales bacterium]
MIQNVLVTGASGFVGSHVVDELHRRGLRVFALMRRSSSSEWLQSVPHEVRQGSLSDVESLYSAVRGMDAIIHVAGATTAPSRESYFDHNAWGTQRLVQAVLQQAPSLQRFIHVSSLAASGPTLNGGVRVESDPPHLVSAYGESKQEGERQVQELASRIPCLSVRPPLVFGPRDRGVLTIAQTAARGWMPLLPSEPPVPSKRYSQIYVEDLAQGIVDLTMSPNLGWNSGEAFFLSAPEIVTQEQIFETMASAIGKKLRRIRIPAWSVRGMAHGLGVIGSLRGRSYALNPDKLGELLAPAWTCSPEKVKRVFGFQAATSFAEGIGKTMNWYRERGWI